MEKLKRKIFGVITAILTVLVVSILFIFNYQGYMTEKREIQSSLIRVGDNKNINNDFESNKNINSEMEKVPKEIDENEQAKNQNDNPIFMDLTAYTIFLDENGEITDVINHSQNDISEDEIKVIAEKILEQKDVKEFLVNDNTENNNSKNDTYKSNFKFNNKALKIKVTNLYFNQYSYACGDKNNVLTIVDNSKSHTRLVNVLKTSSIIFIISEIAILFISSKLTKWMIKPVIETFNKQKQFIADASHELKTPVAVIMANADALENEPNEKKWLENIKSESERMNYLISELLNLAKLENESEQENNKQENLSKIIERAALTFESVAYENNIKYEYNIKKDILFSCNDNQIKQLVAILVDNAIKHSDENGEVKVNLLKEKGEIILQVTNKGKEIPKELREKIFERFYRVDESRNRNENRYGLGLAIAKNIVQNYNGKIFVSCENGYTTFTVKFK